MVRTLFLDMDGVLIDSERHWQTLEGDWLRSVIPDWRDEHQQQVVGLSMDGLFQFLTTRFPFVMPQQQFNLEYKSLADSVYDERAELMPGCLEFLDSVRSAGLRMAVVSSSPKPWIEVVVARFKLKMFFVDLISADDVGGVGKPDPAVYLYAAAALGEKPGDCGAIEDSENGVIAAHQAGMLCVGFRNGMNLSQNLGRAHLIIEGFSPAALQTIQTAPQMRSRTQP